MVAAPKCPPLLCPSGSTCRDLGCWELAHKQGQGLGKALGPAGGTFIPWSWHLGRPQGMGPGSRGAGDTLGGASGGSVRNKVVLLWWKIPLSLHIQK